MKSIRTYLFVWLAAFTFLPAHPQKVTSNVVRFKLNNTIAEEAPEKDTLPPEVKLIQPAIEKGSVFKTETEELDLIGEVKDGGKIRFVSINREVPILNESGVFVTSIPLQKGMNEVDIRAMDDSNNLTEFQLMIEFEPPVITLEDRIKNEATYYGLIIGVNDYEDENMEDLDNPIRDAENLYHVLTRKYYFETGNVTLLRNPKREEIIQELDALRGKVTDQDNVLIFYAGHGFYDEEAEIGYWLPSDAYLRNTANWFRNSALVDYLKAIDSRHTLLITDACFAGSIFKSRSISLPQEMVYDRIYELPSRKAMTSGTLSEVPDESAFIRYLLQRLEENESTYISSEELYGSLRNAVISNSNTLPRFGEIQNVGNEGGDFIFLKK